MQQSASSALWAASGPAGPHMPARQVVCGRDRRGVQLPNQLGQKEEYLFDRIGDLHDASALRLVDPRHRGAAGQAAEPAFGRGAPACRHGRCRGARSLGQRRRPCNARHPAPASSHSPGPRRRRLAGHGLRRRAPRARIGGDLRDELMHFAEAVQTSAPFVQVYREAPAAGATCSRSATGRSSAASSISTPTTPGATTRATPGSPTSNPKETSNRRTRPGARSALQSIASPTALN